MSQQGVFLRIIKQHSGRHCQVRFTPNKLKFFLNFYPPYIGAGVRIEHISEDWRELVVSMKLRWYNRNAVGTHFGGSLYSMIDPHIMLLLMRILGKDYLVWDSAAQIKFLRPGRGKVTARIYIDDEQINTIKRETEAGEKYFPEFTVQVVDEDGTLVSESKKILYVKKKPQR